MTSRKKSENLSFEEALKELEQIVEQMEQGELPLEQALQQFERGVELTRLSQNRLRQAEQKVQQLLQQQGQSELVPFSEEPPK
ncbi:exodeoxyribonuclease VII small subunit [Lacimicrobium alkaliphilum]|uniref:Exodeoxyribonuclease 7 small subunit n=1 Tax=Lacimicrobium alkaliphilum TaxID=1526571 RepID=A0A0U2ZMX4_9ALTE|nr:exodeoxyribonuclease VII small subunit [Lacimicrobium alkaliphilum]ALS99644.1 exodeoxyribonuclease VII small subunit [Lacimicrobium alkaliphilum]